MNICERCNGCGWENPAQAIDKCSSCGGSGRERLTFTHLVVHTARLNIEGKTETTITLDEFHDLKRDMDFVNSFHWADTQNGIPTEFKCNNVTVRIK